MSFRKLDPFQFFHFFQCLVFHFKIIFFDSFNTVISLWLILLILNHIIVSEDYDTINLSRPILPILDHVSLTRLGTWHKSCELWEEYPLSTALMDNMLGILRLRNHKMLWNWIICSLNIIFTKVLALIHWVFFLISRFSRWKVEPKCLSILAKKHTTNCS